MKKMKLKKRRFKWRLIGYAFLIFLGYQIAFNVIMNIKLADSNDTFIKCLLVDSNYHLLYEKKANNLFSRLFTHFFDVNKPVSILENSFHYKNKNVQNAGFVSNPKVETVVEEVNPLVYFYNTHQAETYQGKALESYNITPGVMMASYIFQDKLEKEGINTLVMEDNLIDYMNLNNMNHSQSYKASRLFISETIKNTSSLKLIIDLHRDSVPKEKATALINDKSCAKIVFVIGSEYDSYEDNLEFTNKLNNMIKEKYPSLTRGVMIKGGKGSNGVYNQDLDSHITLMELGSDTSTIDEVLNTIDLLAPIIKEFVNE